MNSTSTRIAFLLILLSFGGMVSAEVEPTWNEAPSVIREGKDLRSSYQNVTTVSGEGLQVPTVFEVPLVASTTTLYGEPLVVADAESSIIASRVIIKTVQIPATVRIFTEKGEASELTDHSTATNVAYELPESRAGLATLTLRPERSVQTSGITFSFERNVTRPTFIEVRSFDEYGNEIIVLSRTRFTSDTIFFVPTRTAMLNVYLDYTQPLTLTEVTLNEDGIPFTTKRSVRFLAQPNTRYSVYDGTTVRGALPYLETGNLMSDAGVVVPTFVRSSNPRYVEPDTDGDLIPDGRDNCISIQNSDQNDEDMNRVGDACDDYDRDGIVNPKDNCASVQNSDQRDTDGDGIGDVCDTAESRFTERMPWVPWAGMGIAGLVILGLFVTVLRQTKNNTTTLSN